jgi:hypothetical protein
MAVPAAPTLGVCVLDDNAFMTARVSSQSDKFSIDDTKPPNDATMSALLAILLEAGKFT